jgi:hypothetical protein
MTADKEIGFSLNKSLLKFQEKIGIIKKDSKNPHFKNTYASLSQILSEVKPVLTDVGIVVLQPVTTEGVGTTIIDSNTGEKIETFIPFPLGLTPQQLGSAITYFRRYTLASLLSLEIDDDDDGHHASQKPKQREEEKKPSENHSKETMGFIDMIKQTESLADLQSFFVTTKDYCKKKGYSSEEFQKIINAKDLRKEHFESQSPPVDNMTDEQVEREFKKHVGREVNQLGGFPQ